MADQSRNSGFLGNFGFDIWKMVPNMIAGLKEATI
jgi:hypothetical protein